VLKFLKKATTYSHCDWGPPPLSSKDLGHDRLDVGNVQNVIHLVCLSARHHAEKGQGLRALDELFAGLSFAHRVGKEGLLIARVLESAGGIKLIQTLGRILPLLNVSTLEELLRRLEVLPPLEPASTTFRYESRFILNEIRETLMTLGPVIEGAMWERIGLGEEDVATVLRLTGGERDRVLAHYQSAAPALAELAHRLDLPHESCRASLDEFAKAERLVRPVVADLVEKAWGIRHMVDRLTAFRFALRAGSLLVRDGEPAFLKVADPFGTGPFLL